ncbi:MAG: 4-hydroxy-3-methylbut-2-enyl diphosphate reductase [Sphingobacteriia bacterium]|nr:MAG: 4-hydroxy-3-methylbut-2-enyl diphosphate reductase [Sphingobacteriia bacterium]
MKQFTIPTTYRSNLISAIKEKRKAADKLKKDFSPTPLQMGDVTIFLARHFGFCYGVENAIEIAFRTIENNPGKRIFLLSEMIHNPQVNADLEALGVRFLQDTYGNPLIPFEQLTDQDIVVIPAFGTTREMEEKLKQKGIAIEQYNTTCPFVEKVWNRGEQIARKGYSIVVHGKPQHEETRATFSHAAENTPTVVVKDMAETILLGKYITGEEPLTRFAERFAGRFSKGFDPTKDLARIGVINQTTQLATDTQAIADYLKALMAQHHGLSDANIGERFADTRDTLCYATNDNQSAVKGLLETPADLAIVVGGANSSNSSHLVELCEAVLPTYFIDGPDRLINAETIDNCQWQTKERHLVNPFLPAQRPVRILVTAGASCPDAVVEAVIKKLAEFLGTEYRPEELMAQLA